MVEKLSQILSEPWLIRPQNIAGYIPALMAYINAGVVPKVEREKMYFAAQPSTVQGWRMYYTDETPQNSVAIIPVTGAVTSDMSAYIERDIAAANANENIVGILLYTNTPGGSVNSAVSISEAITASEKPVATFVKGYAFSAGMWIAAHTARIFLANEMTEVGSIGVMMRYMDVDTMLKEKLGMTIYELYASKSTAKNEEIRALLSGNTEPMMNSLDFINEKFHSIIRTRLKVTSEEPFTGKTYYAPQAIEMKLAHQIAPIMEAVQWVYEASLKQTINKYLI